VDNREVGRLHGKKKPPVGLNPGEQFMCCWRPSWIESLVFLFALLIWGTLSPFTLSW